MDFSQFNGGEQATMTKVIEKKQASHSTSGRSQYLKRSVGTMRRGEQRGSDSTIECGQGEDELNSIFIRIFDGKRHGWDIWGR